MSEMIHSQISFKPVGAAVFALRGKWISDIELAHPEDLRGTAEMAAKEMFGIEGS
jgi:hypothetical protein